MKKRIVGAVLTAMAIILLASLTGCQGGRVKELEAENQALQSQVSQLITQVADKDGRIVEKDARIGELETQVGELRVESDNKSAELVIRDAKIKELGTQITRLQAEVAKIPKDPTHAELKTFLTEDKTNEKKGLFHPEYVRDLLIAAGEVGIKGHTILARISGDYYFAGFNTTDKGWIYIIAATDKEIPLEVGKRLTELLNLPPASYDDRITRITIFP